MKKIFIICLIILPLSLFGAEFHIDTDQENEVRFTSRAAKQEFDGVTDKIDGYIMWEDTYIITTSEFYLEVPLATFDTGIGLRNRHMRDNYLETDTYPYANYTGKISQVDTLDSETLMVTTTGTLDLHGVKKPLKVAVDISSIGVNYLANAEFSLLLPDHNIEIPSFMMLKLNEKVDIKVRIHDSVDLIHLINKLL